MKENKPKNKYLWTVKVGEKAQIVIPKEAREVFGIEAGDTLLLLGDKKRGIAIVTADVFDKFEALMAVAQEESAANESN